MLFVCTIHVLVTHTEVYTQHSMLFVYAIHVLSTHTEVYIHSCCMYTHSYPAYFIVSVRTTLVCLYTHSHLSTHTEVYIQAHSQPFTEGSCTEGVQSRLEACNTEAVQQVRSHVECGNFFPHHYQSSARPLVATSCFALQLLSASVHNAGLCLFPAMTCTLAARIPSMQHAMHLQYSHVM